MFEISYSELNERKEIYDLIKNHGKKSPQEIVNFINNHRNMHFGTTDLTIPLSTMIMYAYTVNVNIAKTLVNEYKLEIDFSYLIYHSIVDNIAAENILDFVEYYNPQSTSHARQHSIAILLQTFKHAKAGNKDYFALFLDNKKLVCALSEKNIADAFHTLTRHLMVTELSIGLWKELIIKHICIADKFEALAVKDEEILKIFFKDAADIFLF